MSKPHDEEMLEMVAVFALGGIDAATGECADVREHLEHCDICKEEFRVARAAAAAVGLSAAQAAPASLRERVLSSLPLQSTQRVTPIDARRRRAWFVRAVAAAAIIIGIGMWWNVHRTHQTWAATCVPGIAGCHASGTVTAAGDRLHMQINGLAALPAGKQYQAWVIPPGGEARPEPVFSADQQGAGTVEIPEAPVKGALVAITIEPAGGSLKPTSKPFLVAKLD